MTNNIPGGKTTLAQLDGAGDFFADLQARYERCTLPRPRICNMMIAASRDVANGCE